MSSKANWNLGNNWKLVWVNSIMNAGNYTSYIYYNNVQLTTENCAGAWICCNSVGAELKTYGTYVGTNKCWIFECHTTVPDACSFVGFALVNF